MPWSRSWEPEPKLQYTGSSSGSGQKFRLRPAPAPAPAPQPWFFLCRNMTLYISSSVQFSAQMLIYHFHLLQHRFTQLFFSLLLPPSLARRLPRIISLTLRHRYKAAFLFARAVKCTPSPSLLAPPPHFCLCPVLTSPTSARP